MFEIHIMSIPNKDQKDGKDIKYFATYFGTHGPQPSYFHVIVDLGQIVIWEEFHKVAGLLGSLFVSQISDIYRLPTILSKEITTSPRTI